MVSIAEHELLSGRRIAIVGGGAIGIETAIYGQALGARVTVYERGGVAEHVRAWGHIPLFTPFAMNHTRLGRHTLEAAGRSLPEDEAYQTGTEWRESYLKPLAECGLAGSIQSGCSVRAIGRGALLKGEHIGDEHRAGHSFRLLVEADGVERFESADLVFDCSGTYSNPNWLGEGGVPALGERRARSSIVYHPVDVDGTESHRFARRRTLLVGAGHSAATTALALARLATRAPGTRVLWVTRGDGPVPIAPIESDSLARRAQLTQAANRLATDPGSPVEWLPGSAVRRIDRGARSDGFDVVLATPAGERSEAVDRVIANVGYEPDSSIYRELQVHECYASRGVMKLAASLLAAGADADGDCLKLGGFGPDVLRNPEPGFFILGMKSYGRNSAFLLRTGHEQIRDAFRLVTGEADLDLFASVGASSARGL